MDHCELGDSESKQLDDPSSDAEQNWHVLEQIGLPSLLGFLQREVAYVLCWFGYFDLATHDKVCRSLDHAIDAEKKIREARAEKHYLIRSAQTEEDTTELYRSLFFPFFRHEVETLWPAIVEGRAVGSACRVKDAQVFRVKGGVWQTLKKGKDKMGRASSPEVLDEKSYLEQTLLGRRRAHCTKQACIGGCSHLNEHAINRPVQQGARRQARDRAGEIQDDSGYLSDESGGDGRFEPRNQRPKSCSRPSSSTGDVKPSDIDARCFRDWVETRGSPRACVVNHPTESVRAEDGELEGDPDEVGKSGGVDDQPQENRCGGGADDNFLGKEPSEDIVQRLIQDEVRQALKERKQWWQKQDVSGQEDPDGQTPLANQGVEAQSSETRRRHTGNRACDRRRLAKILRRNQERKVYRRLWELYEDFRERVLVAYFDLLREAGVEAPAPEVTSEMQKCRDFFVEEVRSLRSSGSGAASKAGSATPGADDPRSSSSANPAGGHQDGSSGWVSSDGSAVIRLRRFLQNHFVQSLSILNDPSKSINDQNCAPRKNVEKSLETLSFGDGTKVSSCREFVGSHMKLTPTERRLILLRGAPDVAYDTLLHQTAERLAETLARAHRERKPATSWASLVEHFGKWQRQLAIFDSTFSASAAFYWDVWTGSANKMSNSKSSQSPLNDGRHINDDRNDPSWRMGSLPDSDYYQNLFPSQQIPEYNSPDFGASLANMVSFQVPGLPGYAAAPQHLVFGSVMVIGVFLLLLIFCLLLTLTEKILLVFRTERWPRGLRRRRKRSRKSESEQLEVFASSKPSTSSLSRSSSLLTLTSESSSVGRCAGRTIETFDSHPARRRKKTPRT